MFPLKTILIGISLVILIIVGLFTVGYEKINSGYEGIEVNLYGAKRGVSDVTKATGAVWYWKPSTEIHEFPTFTQTKDYEPFTINTSDGAPFKVDPKMNHYVIADSVPKIFRQFRKTLPEIESGYLGTLVYNSYRNVAANYTSDSLVANRTQFETEVETKLGKTMLKAGFILQELTSKIDPPQSLVDMIDDKNKSIQAKLTAENLASQAISEAKVDKAKAEGAAAALMIRAKAEADANRLRQVTLTEPILRKMWIEKWNGELPTTLPGNSTLMMGIK